MEQPSIELVLVQFLSKCGEGWIDEHDIGRACHIAEFPVRFTLKGIKEELITIFSYGSGHINVMKKDGATQYFIDVMNGKEKLSSCFKAEYGYIEFVKKEDVIPDKTKTSKKKIPKWVASYLIWCANHIVSGIVSTISGVAVVVILVFYAPEKIHDWILEKSHTQKKPKENAKNDSTYTDNKNRANHPTP